MLKRPGQAYWYGCFHGSKGICAFGREGFNSSRVCGNAPRLRAKSAAALRQLAHGLLGGALLLGNELFFLGQVVRQPLVHVVPRQPPERNGVHGQAVAGLAGLS